MEKGNNILILIDGAAVAGCRANEIQVGGELIEIASPDTGQWRTFIAGRKEWGFTSGWLVTAHADIKRLLWQGRTVTVRIIGRGDSTGLTGTAIVQQCNMSSSVGNLAQGSFSFKGSGPLEEET